MGKARVRLAGWSLVIALALLAAAPVAAHAARAVGVIPPNTLIAFDTASPGTGTFQPISGLGANETVRGIDLRPADGQLYAVTVTTGSAANSVLRTYKVDPGTGAATLVGATAAALAGAADVPTGWDFNPVVDRIRYVNTSDENARINPNNGALAANDTDLAPASMIVAAAYDRNQAGATATTLFAINRTTSQLAQQGGVDGTPSPNGGAITNIGALGFSLNATADAGFDIAPSGTAYAAMTDGADNLTRLYTVNLATGTATPVGLIGIGASEVRSLTILPEPPAPPPPPPPSPPPPAPPDVRPPIVLAVAPQTARLASVTRRRVAIKFSCNEACTAKATLRLGRTVLARGTATLSDANVGRLRLRTTATQRRAISRLQRSRTRRRAATLTLTFTDRAGNRRTLTRRLTLTR